MAFVATVATSEHAGGTGNAKAIRMAKKRIRNAAGRKVRRKPDSIPSLTKKLDAIFSRWVRLDARDEYGQVACFTCDHVGTVQKMQAGHWIPRQHMATRWQEWNVHPQCFACNMYYGGRPQEYRERLVMKFGEKEVEKMAARRHEVHQWSKDELKAMIEKYKKRLAKLESS